MHSVKYLQGIIQDTIDKQQFIKPPELLYEPISYTLSMGGKRLRPLLVLMACDLFGGDIKKALSPSLGIEVFHNFTLVHDDIMDDAPIRRGKETVYKKWNRDIAILSGDAMYALAYEFFLNVDISKMKDVLKAFNKVVLEVCEGQQYDMNYETQKNVTVNDYLLMIRLKTAVLLGASLEIGALISDNVSGSDIEKIYSFGENIGMAFQLKDDLLDVYSDEEKFGKMTGGDIVTNKKTYMHLEAFELASDNDKALLNHFFSHDYNGSDDEKIEKVKDIYTRLGIEGITERLIIEYYDKAMSVLDSIDVDEERKNTLRSFTMALMDRES